MLHYSKRVGIFDSLSKQYVVLGRSNLVVEGALENDSATSEVDAASAAVTRGTTKRHGALFTIIAAIYGGLHVAAWNAHFPSAVEMWMWRGSALSMASFPLFFGFAKGIDPIEF